MMNDAGLELMVDELLQPLAGETPAGRWLRYERAYMELSRSREEDDPNLPLGEWERPLVKANWKQVAADCARLLREESKDFQVAAWLCDAWIRVHQMEGLHAGIALLEGLAQRYWNEAWPAIEDGDADRRVAPFIWMNTSLPLQLKLQVALLPAGPQREQAVRMVDWERASSREGSKPDAEADAGVPQTRQAIRDSVKPADGAWLQQLAQLSAASAERLRTLSTLLDDRLGKESPSLARLLALAEAIGMAAGSLLQEIPAPAAAPEPAPPAAPVQAAPAAAPQPAQRESAQADNSGFIDRTHAYQVLEAAAIYLAQIEPHSPTPYMIRRAVQLGQMSLPEMLRQVTADAGSLDKFFALLGIRPPN